MTDVLDLTAGREPVVLTDGVVTLSSPVEADIDAIWAHCQDPEVQAWTTVPAPYSRADAEYFVREVAIPGWRDGTRWLWGIREDGPDGALHGMVSLHDRAAGSASLGFWLAPASRGRGLMRRAARLAADFALDPEGLGDERVYWEAHVGNWASWAVAWRCGFRFEGQVRRHSVQRGERRDAWVATLLRDDPREPAIPWPGFAPVTPSGTPPAAQFATSPARG